MKKDEYIQKVLEGIRCKSVHESLKNELETHIEEKKECLVSEGVPESEAEEIAVKDMGDPIDTGVQLDAAHRPKFPAEAVIWSMLLMLAGVIVRSVIYSVWPNTNLTNRYLFDNNEIAGLLAGITSAALFCFIDYTFFARLSKKVYAIYTVGYFLLSCGMFVMFYASASDFVNSESYRDYMHKIPFYGSLFAIPLICGFVYSMRGKGVKGFLFACAGAAVPCMLASAGGRCISGVIGACFYAFVIMTAAVKNDYFNINKKKAYIFLCSSAVITILMCAGIKLLHGIAYNRGAFASWSAIWGYKIKLISSAKIFGASESEYFIPDHSILTLILKYGVVPGGIAALAGLVLPIIMFERTATVHNRFGRIIAFSISNAFCVQIIWYIGSNLFIPYAIESYITFPFFDGGILGNSVWGALTGIFASVCTRADLMPERKLETPINS